MGSQIDQQYINAKVLLKPSCTCGMLLRHITSDPIKSPHDLHTKRLAPLPIAKWKKKSPVLGKNTAPWKAKTPPQILTAVVRCPLVVSGRGQSGFLLF